MTKASMLTERSATYTNTVSAPCSLGLAYDVAAHPVETVSVQGKGKITVCSCRGQRSHLAAPC
jgi:hypothetical protein